MSSLSKNISIFLIIMFSSVYVFVVFFQEKIETDLYIGESVAQVQKAMQKIHADCTIISIDRGIQPVNFLNVKAFTGSEVGPLNLARPEKWHGPYLYDNPTVNGIYFNLVQVNSGIYIVPGDGVSVGHHLIMGKDVLINNDTDIDAMIMSGGILFSQKKPLAAKLSI